MLFVGQQVAATLRQLPVVEAQRDEWQRPREILDRLDLHPGNVVVDLGSGAGYFSLKLAPLVGASGLVLAVDLRRESLAFLWMRSRRRALSNIRIIHGDVDDPHVPPVPVDAVLIANTYHELTAPEPILRPLWAAMRRGARMVVVDRAPAAAASGDVGVRQHEIALAVAADDIQRLGFQLVSREDRFIDQSPDGEAWWLAVFRRP